MLDYKDLSEMSAYCDSISDDRLRRMFNQMIIEYGRYKRCGSPADCEQRKEWLEMSYEDIRIRFNEIIQALRNEVADIKKQEATNNLKPKKCKRKKSKEEASTSWDNPPHFNSLEERNLWYK